MLDAAIAFPRDASAISHSSPAALGPVKRLVGEGVRDIEPLGIDLVIDARLERLGEDHGIAKPSGDGLRLGQDRGLLGSAPHAPQAPGLRAESADAQGRMGVGARQVQRLVDPVHGVGVAVSHEPVAAERRRHRERPLGVGLPDRPSERRVEVVDLGVQPGEVLLAARAPERAFGSVALGEREVVAIVALADGLAVGGVEAKRSAA